MVLNPVSQLRKLSSDKSGDPLRNREPIPMHPDAVVHSGCRQEGGAGGSKGLRLDVSAGSDNVQGRKQIRVWGGGPPLPGVCGRCVTK